MENLHSFKIYSRVSELPVTWNIVAADNIFLHSEYLEVLEQSAPANMECRFIGIFEKEILLGVAVSQFLNMSNVESFGERDNHLKTKIRHLFFKSFTSNVLIMGNNMLTGQNAFAFSEKLPIATGIKELYNASEAIRKNLDARGRKVHLVIFKDFNPIAAADFEMAEFKPFFLFSTQPNMVLTFREQWKNFDNYIADLTKRYRDHYKRARKKSDGLVKKKMSVADIELHNDIIHKLYLTVARNAPFNTFYLPKEHFILLKMKLKDRFLFYGYFEGDNLVGFNTLIKNGSDIDTYFLGYSEDCQREKMLYLNMLYDMIGYSINKGFRKIILARTALEIKSSVGAVPEKMIGYIRHTDPIFNYFLPRLFRYFEPELNWHQRHPFKD